MCDRKDCLTDASDILAFYGNYRNVDRWCVWEWKDSFLTSQQKSPCSVVPGYYQGEIGKYNMMMLGKIFHETISMREEW